jgi:hypothetical protein
MDHVSVLVTCINVKKILSWDPVLTFSSYRYVRYMAVVVGFYVDFYFLNCCIKQIS